MVHPKKSKLSTVVQIEAWTRSCCPKFSKLITKASQVQQNERSVYDVGFRKLKIVKSWHQKIKSQDPNSKMTPNKLACKRNCLTCLGALSLGILTRWELRFLFRILLKKRKFLGLFHPKTCSLNKSKLSTVVQMHAWTRTCCLDFSKLITKAAQGQQTEEAFMM